MLIVTDANIPYAPEAFAHLGEVRAFGSRELTPANVRDAEILLVRSTIKVNAALLGGAAPRFVGTATIGTDHVDTAYLARRGIAFASAPGSNADSVGEWWSAALLLLAARLGWDLRGRVAGVVGVGNVGSRVARRAEALGMRVMKCDPPLARATGSAEYRPLGELLAAADVITLHVPLERSGPDATLGLAGAEFFARLKPGAIFVNAARGKVHDNAALLAAIESGRLAATALDVWAGEPLVEPELLARVDLGTPHIAGHSFDGKVNGTQMLYRAVCRLLGAAERWKPEDSLPPPQVPDLDLDGSAFDAQLTAAEAALTLYPIAADDARLREVLALPPERRAAHFTELRGRYPVRRGFHNTVAHLRSGTAEHRRALAGLGFQLA
jgi:erythronate-4-phosphate dehydrogenase